jgi:hypothetical protein
MRWRGEQVPPLRVLAPDLPHDKYSVHYSKAFYCFYPTGVRVIIYTANNPCEPGSSVGARGKGGQAPYARCSGRLGGGMGRGMGVREGCR